MKNRLKRKNRGGNTGKEDQKQGGEAERQGWRGELHFPVVKQ